MADYVRFCEKNFGQVFFLLRRVEIEPLEGSIDVSKREDTSRVAIVEALRRGFVRDHSGYKG